MFGKREDKLLNNNFCVSLNLGLYGFSKVTNIQSSIELENIQEGGYNDYPQMLLRPKSNPETIVLEKGVTNGLRLDTLFVGQKIVAGVIMVMKNKQIVKTYGFDHGVVTKLSVSDLDALGNQILIERVEISHSGLIAI